MDVWPSPAPSGGGGGGGGASTTPGNTPPLDEAGRVPSGECCVLCVCVFECRERRVFLFFNPPTLPPLPVHVFHTRSSAHVRKELADHLAAARAAGAAYTAAAARAAPLLLGLAADTPPLPLDGAPPRPPPTLTAPELDRLGLLLRWTTVPPQWRGCGGEGAAAVDGDAMETDGGDAGATDPPPPPPRLSAAAPAFSGVPDGTPIPAPPLADWLASAVGDAPSPGEASAAAAVAAAAAGPPSPFDDALPPAGVVDGGEVDIQGVCRSTVARGEAAFPTGALRVSDCHDAVIYALAPLATATIVACTDCTIVLGAVGRLLRLDRCERVTLVAASRRVVVDSAHDCALALGVNRPPVILGSSRGVTLGPHCAGYARLRAHMAAAGVTPVPNVWDSPVLAVGGRGGAALAAAGAPNAPATLLPPDRFAQVAIPFVGGPGPLCGGAGLPDGPRLASDAGALLGLGPRGAVAGSADGASGSPASAARTAAASPFPLPPAYEAAREAKVAAIADLRAAVRRAALADGRKRELQAAIQAHFKEWLASSGMMRQVYDLARLEREAAGQR